MFMIRDRQRCGARARTNGGKPCQRWAMPNGRCYLHGGASTGPRTAEGRLRALAAVEKYRYKARGPSGMKADGQTPTGD